VGLSYRSEFLGLSSGKAKISKMKKDFNNFSFENCVKLFFWQIIFTFCPKSFLFHKKMGKDNLTYNLFYSDGLRAGWPAGQPGRVGPGHLKPARAGPCGLSPPRAGLLTVGPPGRKKNTKFW
jgi:hypothetical protein